ncbi:MAG: lycopene cyclase domain-containing protein [Tessaracoccus sp.]|uniref:lycopene cyclase domain-containing protein n=1 Tax=Tessaracoccus sp. TaxID=1971211 RepID=UPI001ED77EF2|nr:lycopene cyclase domain-containing protein [Tessaracoccus sp.]MBK7820070.1 lycopene cyclase domain-containing protein [Tessaracoccus sp.]
MDRWQYLIVLAGCLAVTLPLEFGIGARVYRAPRRLVLAMMPMLVLFVTWDVVGILRRHWWYEERFVSGVHLGPLPLEELLFFIVIPLCALLTYDAVGRILTLARTPGRLRYRWPDGLVRVTDESRTHPERSSDGA